MYFLKSPSLEFGCANTVLNTLQMDTKDILFICGGAFVDLEKTISERLAAAEILTIYCLFMIEAKFYFQTINCSPDGKTLPLVLEHLFVPT